MVRKVSGASAPRWSSAARAAASSRAAPCPTSVASANHSSGGRRGSRSNRASASYPTIAPDARSVIGWKTIPGAPASSTSCTRRALSLIAARASSSACFREAISLWSCRLCSWSRMWSERLCNRLRTRSTTSVRSTGLVRKSFAPAASTRSRAWVVASAVSTMTGTYSSGGVASASACMTCDAVHAGHVEVEQDEVRSEPPEEGDHRRGVLRRVHLRDAGLGERPLQEHQVGLMVVDHQDRSAGEGRVGVEGGPGVARPDHRRGAHPVGTASSSSRKAWMSSGLVR